MDLLEEVEFLGPDVGEVSGELAHLLVGESSCCSVMSCSPVCFVGHLQGSVMVCSPVDGLVRQYRWSYPSLMYLVVSITTMQLPLSASLMTKDLLALSCSIALLMSSGMLGADWASSTVASLFSMMVILS